MIRRGSRGVSITEVLMSTTISVFIIGVAFVAYRGTVTSSRSTFGPQTALQASTRVALLELMRELQECIEFLRPRSGTTLGYLLARDKVDVPMLVYAVRNAGDSQSAGRDVCDLFVCHEDPGLPPERRTRRLLSRVERLGFTALGSGAIQIRLDIREQGRSCPILTTIRARNIALEGSL